MAAVFPDARTACPDGRDGNEEEERAPYCKPPVGFLGGKLEGDFATDGDLMARDGDVEGVFFGGIQFVEYGVDIFFVRAVEFLCPDFLAP